MGKTVGGIFKVIAGVAIIAIAPFLAPIGFGLTLSGVSDIVTGTIGSLTPKPAAELSRLTLTFNGEATRKIVFGETAMNTDGLYQEASGTDQEYIDLIVAVAAHEVDAISTIYTEDKPMWTVAGGAQGDYAGYLTVTPVLAGVSGAGQVINAGSIWNANCSLTGCAYVRLRIKRTGNDKKAESPFAAGIPSRMTIVGRGMKVYDPRRDSTVGGSGSHRANDQTTWQYADGGTVLGTNHALQTLSYLIGWRIGGVVSVGVGMPIARLAMADWIAAANVCDESVLGIRRYEGHGVFGDEDAPQDVLAVQCTHMNAVIRDTGGKIGIRMAINDTAGSLVTFTEDDVLGPHEWQPFVPLNESFNVVRGVWTDPSVASLFQKAPYPARSVTAPDAIDRTEQLDLPMIQDAGRAQRVAEQVLRRAQVGGLFTVSVGPRAWAAEVGQPVRWTFPALGFSSKLFRVVRQRIVVVNSDEDAQSFCEMTFREEDANIYAFTSGDVGAVAAAVPAVPYLPSSQPFLITQGADIGVANDATRNVEASNVVVNSEFTRGTYGFRFSVNTYAGPTLPILGGVNLSSLWSGVKNVLWATVSTSGAPWDAAGAADPFTTRGAWIGGNMADQRAFGLPVKQNDWVFARCLLARHRCQAQLYLLVFDKDGNLLEAPNWTGGRIDGAGGGLPTNFDPIGGTYQITDADAASAQLMWRMLSTSAADPYIFMTEPALGLVPPGQADLPPYQAGRFDPLADRTGDNTANDTAFVAGVAAATLTADAATAKADAASAQLELADISSDGVLTRSEKIRVRQQRNAISNEYPIWRDRADAFGVSRTTYTTTYNDLLTYLASVSIDVNVNTAITRSAFDTAFTNYYGQLEVLIDAIQARSPAVALADDSTTIGTATPITVGSLIAAATSSGGGAIVPRVITGLGASPVVDAVIPAMATLGFQATVVFNLASGTRTLDCPLEYQIGSGGWVGFGTSTPATDAGPSTLFADASGALTNSTGEAVVYQVRSVVTITGSTGGTVDATRSFVGPS